MLLTSLHTPHVLVYLVASRGSAACSCTSGQRALINCPFTTHRLYLVCYDTSLSLKGARAVVCFPGDLHSRFQLWNLIADLRWFHFSYGLRTVGGVSLIVCMCVCVCTCICVWLLHCVFIFTFLCWQATHLCFKTSQHKMLSCLVLLYHLLLFSFTLHNKKFHKSASPSSCPPQIRFLLLFSRQGKLRLQKWYTPLTDREKKKVIRDMMMLVLARPPRSCSFLQWKDLKIVSRRCLQETLCYAEWFISVSSFLNAPKYTQSTVTSVLNKLIRPRKSSKTHSARP